MGELNPSYVNHVKGYAGMNSKLFISNLASNVVKLKPKTHLDMEFHLSNVFGAYKQIEEVSPSFLNCR